MTWRSHFNTIPPTGTVVMIGDQSFEFFRSEPYRKVDGSTVNLTVWRSRCTECQASFFTKTGPSSLGPSRRCKAHRRGGKAVSTSEPSIAEVTIREQAEITAALAACDFDASPEAIADVTAALTAQRRDELAHYQPTDRPWCRQNERTTDVE